MFRFVHDNIKFYDVRERRVIHLAEASPYISVVYGTFTIFSERFEVNLYKQVFRRFKTTGIEHSVCSILSVNREIK